MSKGTRIVMVSPGAGNAWEIAPRHWPDGEAPIGRDYTIRPGVPFTADADDAAWFLDEGQNAQRGHRAFAEVGGVAAEAKPAGADPLAAKTAPTVDVEKRAGDDGPKGQAATTTGSGPAVKSAPQKGA